MNLAEKIQSDLVEAMRAKDELRLNVLRGIKSAIKLKEVEKIKTLDESETIQILQTLVKQRKESIEQFTKGNRPEQIGRASCRERVKITEVDGTLKEKKEIE